MPKLAIINLTFQIRFRNWPLAVNVLTSIMRRIINSSRYVLDVKSILIMLMQLNLMKIKCRCRSFCLLLLLLLILFTVMMIMALKQNRNSCGYLFVLVMTSFSILFSSFRFWTEEEFSRHSLSLLSLYCHYNLYFKTNVFVF